MPFSARHAEPGCTLELQQSCCFFANTHLQVAGVARAAEQLTLPHAGLPHGHYAPHLCNDEPQGGRTLRAGV